jgi:hypothetical protein
MYLNKREAALAIAGVQMLKDAWMNGKPVPFEINDILDEGNARMVSTSRLDVLCEKLNKP